MTETLSVRIPKEDMAELAGLQKLEHRAKSELMREIFGLGIREKKLHLALENFRKKECTAAKAARLAGIPLTLFLDVLKREGIEFHYGVKQVREEFEGLL